MVKPEWEKQLNVYGWMAGLHGLEVKGLRIVALLRDWQVTRAIRGHGYPPIPIKIIDVPMWPKEAVESYVNSRINEHLAAEELPDDELPECTPDERWERPGKWAVYREGRDDRAERLLDTLDEAEEWASKKMKTKSGKVIPHEIVFRPGESTRCKYYCAVKDFCNQNPHKEKD